MENIVKNKTDLWFEWGAYIVKATAGVWFPTTLSLLSCLVRLRLKILKINLKKNQLTQKARLYRQQYLYGLK